MIEINRAKSVWQYHIDPDNPCVIERRVNRNAARAALLELERHDKDAK